MYCFKQTHSQPNKPWRTGELFTNHGIIPTPVFLPVGSQATVKSLDPNDIHTIGSKMILSNTYHLYLRPGMDVIKISGGLHKFMNWDGAILTDSGGYQVFSLAPLRKVNDEGIKFRSHIDGSEHYLTPEAAIEYQVILGSDVIMVLDECPSHDDPYLKIEEAMIRTHRWANRCREVPTNSGQLMFAIVQGGLFPDLRKQSAEYLKTLDFDGYAIGGLSLGEKKEYMYNIIDYTVNLLPENKPRYLMGVGSPEDIVEGVARGIDIFDCVLPTRVARNGALFTWEGRINIRNAKYKMANFPIMQECNCYTCRNFTAAYIHHLFNAGELLAYRLATIHNLTFIQYLLTKIRKAINSDSYDEFIAGFSETYMVTDEQVRLYQKNKWLNNRLTDEISE